MELRLRALYVETAEGQASTGLLHPQHAVIAPPSVPARVLRDAACAVLYGSELFPHGRRAGVREAALDLRANGIDYRCTCRFNPPQRRLVLVQPEGERVIAEGAGPVAQMLDALLRLPSALIYRSLALMNVAADPRRAPDLPAEMLAGLADATALEARAAEVAAADTSLRERRSAAAGLRRARSAARGAAVAAVPLAGAGLSGVLADAPGWGIAAFAAATTALGAGLTTAGRIRHRLAATEASALAAAGARDEAALALDALRKAHAALVIAAGGEAEAPELARWALGGPDPDVADHVEIFAGEAPPPEQIAAFTEPLRRFGPAGATAAWILAACAARPHSPPLFWLGDHPLPTAEVPWDRIYAEAGDTVPMLVFVDESAPHDARPIPLVLDA